MDHGGFRYFATPSGKSHGGGHCLVLFSFLTWETARTMHAPIALIALDLDRTLFRSDTTVSDRTLGAIDACRTQGLHIAIATARPFASVQRLLPASLHRDVPWICGSGGSVYENAVCLYQDLIDVATAQAVVEVLYKAEEDFIVVLEMAGRLYVN